MPARKKIRTPQQMWEYASSKLVHLIERTFFTLGVLVARNPWRTIGFTWLFILLSCIGLLQFHIEKNPMKLWVPPDSDFFYDTNWYIDKFETIFRLQKIIITGDDVLQPHVLGAISDITEKVNSIQVKHENKTYSVRDLCFKVPVLKIFGSDRVSRSVDISSENNSSTNMKNSHEFLDTNLWMDSDFYCGFLNNFPLICHQYNILDLFDKDNLNHSTKHDIVNKINSVKTNPVTGHPMDFTKLLGGVEHDENGDIVSANAILITWFTSVNMSAVDINAVGNLVGTEDWVSVPLAMWEREFINVMEILSNNFTELKVFYEAGRSFADTSGEAILNELDKLFLGIILMFFYIQFALSRFNWLEIKLTLGSVGLLSVGMAYVAAVSWCSIMRVSFGPVHSSLPFLLMGLGIDDMFVINACWKNLTEAESKKSLPVKIGLMLEHAGVSIVITSFTDIVALLVGAITILPSLKSFCIYAAVGVFFIFCFTVTFYVAVFTLDTRRMEDNRNGVVFCYKHSKQIKVSQDRTIFQKGFAIFYEKCVFSVPGKIIIIIFTLIMTGFSIIAMLRLEQRFDPKWFIPDDTYYKDFINAHDYYYPEEGYPSMIFLGEMYYHDEFSKLLNFTQKFAKEPYVTEVSSWVEYFHGYVLENYGRDLNNVSAVTKDEFNQYLSKFLFSSIGGRFQLSFRFEKPIQCGHPTTDIKASSIAFKFKNFKGPEEYLPAMNQAKGIVKSAPISSGDGYRSVWSKVFGNWVTDEIIALEVERNVELALLCVIACTVVLITNLQMCFWIFLCVLLTIVNVLGWMQRWGMTVDIVCCIGLELAIGLCVDYAAHIGHTFLTVSEGTRTARALKTVTSIGTAVLLGGGSTLLSLSLLCMSRAYTFQSFFKIFLLVILFGLFNGLFFLPVVLSLIGPDAYRPNVTNESEAVELKSELRIVSEEMQELNGQPVKKEINMLYISETYTDT